MKKILTCLLVLTMSICLFACHGEIETKPFEIPETFDETQKIEITFWAKNDTNKYQVEVYKKAIEEFENYYPNVTVNISLYTDYQKIYNDVITNIPTKTTPNVCISYPDHVATYSTGNNVIVNLDQLINSEKYGLGGSEVKFAAPKLSEMVPKFMEECKLNGSYYLLPFMRSTEALYMNKTLIEKLGYTIPEKITWDFVFEVAEAATKQNEDGTYTLNKQNVMIPFIYKSTDNMMIQMLYQKGAKYSSEKGEILLFNEDTKDILTTISKACENNSFSTFKISSYPANFFNAGQCIFAIDSTAGSTWMGSEAPLLDIPEDQVVEFETVVSSIPQYDVDNPKMISQGPSICIFNKDNNQEVLASWLFAQYLLSNNTQIAYSMSEGYMPVTTKVTSDPLYVDYLTRAGEDNETHYDVKIDATKMLMDNIENTFVTPAFNGSTSLREASGAMIETVAKSVKRKETIDDAYMSSLFDKMYSQYHLDQINIGK